MDNIYLIIIGCILIVVDCLLIIDLFYLFNKKYKRMINASNEVFNNLVDKTTNVIEKEEIEEEEVIETPKLDKQKLLFSDSFNNLSEEQKTYYDELINYVLSFDNIYIISKDYERHIRYKNYKNIAVIKIKNDQIFIKFNMGNLKVGNGIDPIKLKPIKITFKEVKNLDDAKKTFEQCYLKQIGAININYEEDK